MNINKCTYISSEEAPQEYGGGEGRGVGKNEGVAHVLSLPLPSSSASALPACMAKGEYGGEGWRHFPCVFFFPPPHP